MEIQKPKSGITFLKTKDLLETTRFYRDLMGFKFTLDQKTCRIFKICRNCYLGFCLTNGDTGSEEVIITLEMEDVDTFCTYLESKGIDIDIRPRLNESFNIYQMFIRDPNGYRIEIQNFLDPGWNV